MSALNGQEGEQYPILIPRLKKCWDIKYAL